MSDHPDDDALIAYQSGLLDEPEAARIRRHVVLCAQCQEDLQALAALDEPPESLDEADEESRLEAGWESFVAARESLRSDASRKPRQPRRRVRAVLPLAASILIAILGLTSFLLAPEPGTRPLVVDLLPDGATERSARPIQEIPVPAGFDPLVARVLFAERTSGAAFELGLWDADGREVARLDDAIRDSEGRFALLVSRAELPNGEYRLILSGIESGRRTQLAAYSFRLRDEG